MLLKRLYIYACLITCSVYRRLRYLSSKLDGLVPHTVDLLHRVYVHVHMYMNMLLYDLSCLCPIMCQS